MDEFVALARGEATRAGSTFVGTPHLLLAVLQEEPEKSGPGATAYSCDLYAATRALRELQLDIQWIRGEALKISALTAEVGGAEGDPPLSPRATLVLELAYREALRWGHGAVGSEHLLLALLDDEGGVASQVLVTAGADLARVRSALRERIGA
jgi:ATP-dependent Clp protease ATP-binding subunit ClpC